MSVEGRFDQDQRRRAVRELLGMFVGREPEVQWREDGPDPGAGKQQHQHQWMVQAQPGHPVAGADALGSQHGLGGGNPPGQLAIADGFLLEAQGDLGRPLRRPLVDDAGEASRHRSLLARSHRSQSSDSPDSYRASRPIRSRHSSAVHGSIRLPQRESR